MPGMDSGFRGGPEGARFANQNRIYKTGVEVPASERKWTMQLVESFKGLDPRYQNKILGIIESLRQEDPTRVAEISKQIAEFFNSLGKPGEKYVDLQTFLSNLEEAIKNPKPETIN